MGVMELQVWLMVAATALSILLCLIDSKVAKGNPFAPWVLVMVTGIAYWLLVVIEGGGLTPLLKILWVVVVIVWIVIALRLHFRATRLLSK